VRWRTLLTFPQTWAFSVGKFLTDSMWWFYMTWFPKFLYDHHQLDLKHIGLPLVIVYLHDARGIGLGDAGVALAAVGAGGLVATVVAGVLADRVGAGWTAVGGLVLAGVGTAGYLEVHGAGSAIAAAMPLPAPVTTAILSLRLNMLPIPTCYFSRGSTGKPASLPIGAGSSRGINN